MSSAWRVREKWARRAGIGALTIAFGSMGRTGHRVFYGPRAFRKAQRDVSRAFDGSELHRRLADAIARERAAGRLR
jgi:hypothetical protein